MRCKTCDYTLWNLKARQCPECGTSFKPSEFEFVINSVRFCCPQCDQHYYGTGVKGHLIPDEFTCVKCSARIRMDDMVLRPAEGVQDEQTKVSRLPWLERKDRGFFSGWFWTVIGAMGSPIRMIKGMPADSPQSQAWLFALITLGLFMFCGAMLPLGVISMILFISGDPDAPEVLIAGLIVMLSGTLGTLVFTWIWAAVTHGMLRITGGCTYDMSRTVQIILYGCGTQAASAIPIVGLYCGSWILPIWWIVVAAITVSVGQRVHGGRATLAVLTFPAIVLMGVVAAYILLIVSIMSTAAAAGGGNPRAETLSLTVALRNYAQSHGGVGPAHGSQLITDPATNLGASDFVLWGSGTDESLVPAGDGSLLDLQLLPTNRRAQFAQDLADAQDNAVIAHRLGDFVFTHHMIDFNSMDGQLWTVVSAPDPALSPMATSGLLHVGKLDGSVQFIRLTDFRTALADQNSLRVQEGLPPLTDPRNVTHGAPMIAAPD